MSGNKMKITVKSFFKMLILEIVCFINRRHLQLIFITENITVAN